MDDKWASRDLPVLTAIVEWRDRQPLELGPTVREIADLTGFGIMDVTSATASLSGDYIMMQPAMDDPDEWPVTRVYSAARRATGQWPSGESLVEQLVAGLRAAELTEPDPVQKSRLHALVDGLTGIARDVFVQVATTVVSGSIGQG
jgi:hypothetical protein